MTGADNFAFCHVPGAAARRRFSGLDPNAFAGVKMEKRPWD
jgi:hypothetical protein